MVFLEFCKLIHFSDNADRVSSVDDTAAIEKMKQEYDERMQNLLKKYEDEVKHKEKLAEDINKLKSIYENGKEPVPFTTTEEGGEAVLQAVEKLHAIEEQMVGGEKANDASERVGGRRRPDGHGGVLK